MKRILTVMYLLVWLMVSCQSEDFGHPGHDDIADEIPLTSHEIDILRHIELSRDGVSVESRIPTRGEADVNLTPYVTAGDTLFYIAQYEKGWDLYSPTNATPAVLMSSPVGKFNLHAPEMPPGLKELILETGHEACEVGKSEKALVNTSWGVSTADGQNICASKVTCQSSDGVRREVSEETLPPGKWVLIKKEVTEEENEESPKLIKTHWHQLFPWNFYAKYYKNAYNQYSACVAGCVAIAISQYMYYTHYKDGIPATSPSTATVTADGTDFVFSNYTDAEWDKMPLEAEGGLDALTPGALAAARLIGDVGRKVYSQYGITATGSGPAYSVPFMNSVYDNNIIRIPFDFNVAVRSMKAGYPLVSDAVADGGGGHYFIIDYYQKTSKVFKYTYGYEFDGHNDNGEWPWEDNEYDEWGNIVDYTYKKEEYSYSSSQYISMNWGYGKEYNNIRYYPSGNWLIGNANYIHNRYFHVRKEFNK